MCEVKAEFPSKIDLFIEGKAYTAENIGMSSGTVLVFDDMVLKIEDHTEKIDSTVKVMQWLNNKIPVPKVICYEVSDGKSYLLMSKIKGVMSCDEACLEDSERTVTALADGLEMLWNVDIAECPRIFSLDSDLAEARYNVINNISDLNEINDFSFSDTVIEAPIQLLEWPENNRSEYELALSHGDYSLPNIFISNGKISGFIDLGDMGIADKYKDIVSCYRSLKNNFNGSFGGKVYESFDPDILLSKLNIKIDPDKLRYYMLLDMLL